MESSADFLESEVESELVSFCILSETKLLRIVKL